MLCTFKRYPNMNRVHPLIHLADTIALIGDPLQTLRATFEKEQKYLKQMGGEGHIELVSAHLLAEFVLYKRRL